VSWSTLVPLPVVLPLVGAGIAVAVGRHPRLQRFVSALTLTAVVTVSALLLYATDSSGIQVVEAGGWPAPMGVVLVVDRLSALMLLVSSVVTLGVFVYSTGEGRAGGDEDTPLPIYHPTLLVLMAGVADTFVSGDLFNLYVGFEILLAASFVLITLGGTATRIRAGSTYVVVSLLSSLVFLVAIALVYAATGTVNLAQLSVRLGELPANVALVLQLALLVGFGVKAAVFPMSGWLPDSYPTAPAPVTAVFAGLLTKVGVYAILRTQTLLFPDSRLQNLLLVAALATMLVGILGAVAQDDIKRLLSFTLVSHIGYMLFGIAVASATGISAAIFYVAHHITIQTTLFLVTGLIERRAGSTSLRRLGGLATASPVIAVLFFIPAMNLAGVPPFSGFLGKVGLLQAGAAAGTGLSYELIGGSVLTSLLTLYAMSRVWSRAFWQAPTPEVLERGEAPGPESRLTAGLVVPTAAMVLIGVGLTVVAGPLFGFTDAAAGDLLTPSTYVDAVFPGGIR
jgi:multicomponent Na+:H+ antiporter subunit D